VEHTSIRRLFYMSRDTFRSIDPGETSIGTPTHYVPEGWQPRFAVPAGTGVWAVSTSAGDTAPEVRVDAIGGTSLPAQPRDNLTVTLNGVTRVPLSTTVTDLTDLVTVTLSSVCAGDVSLYDDAVAGRELTRIPRGRTAAQYWCVRLWPTPSGAITYYLDGQIEIPVLVLDTDIPMLAPSFHDILAAYARMREYERTGDNRYGLAQQEWLDGLKQLRAAVNFPDDYKPVAGSRQIGWSNLGGQFPADQEWP